MAGFAGLAARRRESEKALYLLGFLLARPEGFEPPTRRSVVPLSIVRGCSLSSKLLGFSGSDYRFRPPLCANVQRVGCQNGCQVGCQAKRAADRRGANTKFDTQRYSLGARRDT
jgi:hypothetical protein